MDRRSFLAATGASALAATAGCSGLRGGDDDDSGEADDDTPDGDETEDTGNESTDSNDTGDETDDTSAEGSNSDETGGTDGPEGIVQEFYDLQNDVDGDTSASVVLERLQGLAHSASPFMTFSESDIDPSAQAGVTIDNVDTQILDEDLSADELTNQYALTQFETIGEEELAAIAAENAVVEANIDQSGEGVAEGDEQVAATHLAATENGEWLLIF